MIKIILKVFKIEITWIVEIKIIFNKINRNKFNFQIITKIKFFNKDKIVVNIDNNNNFIGHKMIKFNRCNNKKTHNKIMLYNKIIKISLKEEWFLNKYKMLIKISINKGKNKDRIIIIEEESFLKINQILKKQIEIYLINSFLSYSDHWISLITEFLIVFT